jgi:hypothetical protein
MYFSIIKNVLDVALESLSEKTGIPSQELCRQMGIQLAEMAKQHREDDPTIPYEDPICRLGYLYKHVTANATLFERALFRLGSAREAIRARAGKILRISSVGGGPGSEVLGLAKHLVQQFPAEGRLPSRLEFTVLDRFPQWGESWTQLAEQTEQMLIARSSETNANIPPISPQFYPMDITKADSYLSYAWLFDKADLIVFNYVISENLSKLDELAGALTVIGTKANAGASFVFIDRKEYSGRINNWLVKVLPDTGFAIEDGPAFEDGCLSREDQVDRDLGEYPRLIGQRPRCKFFTDGYREPTAFFIGARKAGPASR